MIDEDSSVRTPHLSVCVPALFILLVFTSPGVSLQEASEIIPLTTNPGKNK